MTTHIKFRSHTFTLLFLDHKPTRHDIHADVETGAIQCGPNATTDLLRSVLEELAAFDPQPATLIPVVGFVQ